MTSVTNKRVSVLVRKLFELLMAHPDGMKSSEALAALASQVTLSHHEAGHYESGGRRFENIVRFSTIGCVKAGWLVRHKGIWIVTDEGAKACQTFSDPEAFYNESARIYRKWRNSQPDTLTETSSEEATKQSAAITLEEAEESASREIEEFLAQMPPFEFQTLVGELLCAMGYHVGWEAPPGRDGGIDLIAFNDPLGTRPPRIKVQVKRNAGSPRIDVTALRSFMAVLSDDDMGLFVALSGFTKDAENEARLSHRHITLIDTARFVELWTAHHTKLDDTARRRLPLKPVWFLTGKE